MVVLSSKSGEITFVCKQKPSAKSVYLAGSFNEWSPNERRMVKSKDGTFRARLKLKPGKYEYKFVVDGEWVEDTEEKKVSNELGSVNNVVEVSEK